MKPVHASSSVVLAPRQCPRCGGVLGGFGPEGLCGPCLLRSGLRELPLPEPALAPPMAGSRRFGDYELLGEIARGGMGVVFRARQISLNRIVAVKMVLRGEFAGTAELARFRHEAEAAARLKHPNIVAIHEVGECEGQPFFSMDFVEGRSLSASVREGPLGAALAARYLEKIARAVHYAHERGVLHRDLKPSNVLLDEHDEPHVTDFGLAKRLDDSSIHPKDPDLTLPGQVLGTPSFMPPEQASGHREQMGPHNDVYSLGAILYHLITGRPPFVGTDPHTILNQVLFADPVAPRLLNPSVPRDLETIALKCLEKSAARRYHSALALAEDIARFLRHEPIHAVPPSAVYRTRKFVRRHRAAVAGGLAFVLMLTAATVVSTILGLRAEHNRKLAVQAQKQESSERIRANKAETEATGKAREAQEAAEEAKAVLGFLTDKVLAAARPVGDDWGLGRNVTLREAVEAAEADIPLAFTNHPLVEAEVRQTLAKTFSDLGDYPKAVTQLEQVIKLYNDVKGPDHPASVSAIFALGQAYDDARQRNKSIPLMEKALALTTSASGVNSRKAIESRIGLGNAYFSNGDFSLAETNIAAALQLARDTRGTNDPTTLRALGSLAGIYQRTRRVKEALAMRQEVLRGRRASLGPRHKETLLAMANLAAALQDSGKWEEAIAQHDELLLIQEANLGPDHPSTLRTLHNAGVAHAGAGRAETAVSLLERAYRLGAAKLGADHPEALFSLAMLIRVMERSDRHAATPLLFSNLLYHVELQKAPSVDVLQDLASEYGRNVRYGEAVALRENILKLSLSRHGPEDPRTIECQHDLANAYLHYTNRFAEAEILFRKVLAAERVRVPDTPALATVLGELGLTLVRENKFAEAEPPLREAVPLYQKFQPQRTSTYTIYVQLGRALLGQQKLREANQWLVRAQAGLARCHQTEPSPASGHYLKQALESLVTLSEALGLPDDAAKWRQELKSLAP